LARRISRRSEKPIFVGRSHTPIGDDDGSRLDSLHSRVVIYWHARPVSGTQNVQSTSGTSNIRKPFHLVALPAQRLT
jgi:hypothetical protein